MFSLFLFRVIEKIGYIKKLKYLDENLFYNEIKNYKYEIICFFENELDLSFMDFSIFKYFNKIKFFISNSFIGKSIGCQEFPCILSFLNGIPDLQYFGPFTSSDFSIWCETIINNKLFQINSPDQLRIFLESGGSKFFGIDINNPPNNFLKNDIFISISSKIFNFFNFNLSKGYYIFRNPERQLIKINNINNYKKYLNSKLFNFKNYNYIKKFYGGFIINSTQYENNEKEMEILINLNEKFYKNFDLGPISGGLSILFTYYGNLTYFKTPIFIIFKNGFENEGRFLILNNLSYNLDHLNNFLNNIENEK